MLNLRKLENAVFQNTKWWLSLKSKSIRKVNSTILKLFEAKPSILVNYAYPSFSTKFDIILRKCCKKNVCKSVAYWMTKQMPISPFTVFVANFLDHIVVAKTNSDEVFFSLYHSDIILFSTSFLSNIFQNPQIKLYGTKIKHSKRLSSLTFFPNIV